jgi:hypothetical protein
MTYTEQLERETEQTRLRLANTMEELRERLTPGQVLDEVLDYASTTGAGDYLRNFRRQVIDNPLPLGLMGMSVAWLMAASVFGGRGNGHYMADMRGTARGMRDSAADRARTMGDGLGDSARAMGDRGRAIGDRARGAAGDLAAGARGAAADVADRADEMSRGFADSAADLRADAAQRAANITGQASAVATRTRDRMRDAAASASAGVAVAGDTTAESAGRGVRAIGDSVSEMGRGGRAASRAVADFGREQPLIVAATGLVLGTIIGALLPKTDAEDRLIGESSETAKEKLREFAGEQYSRAKDIAAQTVGSALEANDGGGAATQPHETGEFGPGPGPQASGDHSSNPEDAERTHAGGD